jgi:acetate---CoA ligase (ADP-forming)
VAVTAPALDLPDAGGVLTEAESLRLFKALGVTVAETVVLAPDGPVPDGIAYPVAAKVLSADVPHKTEAGGVVLNVADAAGLEAARTRILASVRAHVPGARVDGIAVQPMAAGLAEALVGYRLDPEVGPVVTVALGGVLAEIYADAAVRLAPVDRATARGMVLAVKGLATVRGYRGLPKGDIESLAAAVEALSSLALVPRVLEAEINPMIVRAEGAGVIAVDGLVRVAGR